MDKRLKILLIPVVLIVLFYGGFAALMFASDIASYNGNEIYVGPIDYDSVLANAEKAGYDVSGPDIRLSGENVIKRGSVEALDNRFNTEYVVNVFDLNYNESTYLEFFTSEGSGTVFELYNLHQSSDNKPVEYSGKENLLQPSDFPDDKWMLEMFGLVFGMDETRSLELLESLKHKTPQDQWTVNMSINKSVDFPAVYAYLNQTSTNTVVNTGISNNEEFSRNGKKIGYINYIIPQATVRTSHHFNKYSVDVSSSGYVRAAISMHAGSSRMKISEEEYRAIFKEMFEKLGMNPEKVDEMKFEYSPSVW